MSQYILPSFTEKIEGISSTTADTVQGPAPVAAVDRIQTMDLVRGVALLGILLMNIPIFGIDWSAYYNILTGSRNTADYYTMMVIETFLSGTMRGLFSMLFGAGMVLFLLNKKEGVKGVPVAELYYRRLLWLVVFGIINAYVLLWRGDILFFYGLIGMLLFPFRKLAARWLFLLGFVCIGIGVYKNMLNHNESREKRMAYVQAVDAEKANKKLSEKQQSDKAAWLEIEKNRKPNPESTKENVNKLHSGYVTVFSYFNPHNAGSETWGMYHGIWDMLSMMLIGMGLFRLGFFSDKSSTSTYTLLLLLGYGVGIPLGYILFQKLIDEFLNYGMYLDSYRVSHQVLYDIRRVLLSLGHASLIMLVYRSRILPWLVKGLSNVGQMAFTNYLMQSIFCTLIFTGVGLGYYNKFAFHQLYYIVCAIWLFQIVFSWVWLRYYYFGPFEWVWRSLTYWEKQRMRKTENTSTEPLDEKSYGTAGEPTQKDHLTPAKAEPL